MKPRFFIITIDTEGDNLWRRITTPNGQREISVENAKYIGRFQRLCEKYNFIPTYLVDYEMAMSDFFCDSSKEWIQDGLCEIGMHMHAWNNPPLYNLPYNNIGHNPYAGEYPEEVLYRKIENITDVIEKRFKVKPRSHRGGRWYLDSYYVESIINLGYIVDCTITPGISWKDNIGNKVGGPDYSKYPMKSFFMDHDKSLLQVPPTIMRPSLKMLIKEAYNRPYDMKEIIHKKIWLRPNGTNLREMLYIINQNRYSSNDYIEFMIHSSELMPGGSPTFPDKRSIEVLFADLDRLFEEISKIYKGISLSEYAIRKFSKISN